MKTILISGAVGNLGEAVVDAFATHNYWVEAAVRKLPLSTTLTSISYTPIDLLDEIAAHTFVEHVISKHTKIDAAALLAGGFAMGHIADTDYNRLEQMLLLNFKTAYTLVRPLFTHMLANGGGTIIVISSEPGLQPKGGAAMLAYTLSKAMLATLAEMLNTEGREKKVVVHVLAPGTIDTPTNRAAMPKADFSSWVKPETLSQKMVELCEAPFSDQLITTHTFY
jgi:NAD(P)-dependent dehydrogenase (short-subunit alcohol dehydrogenase family)